MKIAIVHNRPQPHQPDSADVLAQAGLVAAALDRLHLDHAAFAADTGLPALRLLLDDLHAWSPDVIFNLVEAWEGDPRRAAAAAGLWEVAGLPYTGARFAALVATTDKVQAKMALSGLGLPTPEWQILPGKAAQVSVPGPWIIKPAWEDGSVGIDDQSVVRERSGLERWAADARPGQPEQPWLVEHFLEGREFNVSLLALADGRAEVLPPAEILFTDWPKDKPKIVNYAAKWRPETFEFHHTPRSFDAAPGHAKRLAELAQACWKGFGLTGYARVDFRADQQGNLYVIEINGGPCIAPDSGFIAAAKHAGYEPHQVVERIIAAATRAAGLPGHRS